MRVKIALPLKVHGTSAAKLVYAKSTPVPWVTGALVTATLVSKATRIRDN